MLIPWIPTKYSSKIVDSIKNTEIWRERKGIHADILLLTFIINSHMFIGPKKNPNRSPKQNKPKKKGNLQKQLLSLF